MYGAWTGVALGALFWLWRRARRRRQREREQNRRAHLPSDNDLSEATSLVVMNAQNVELHVRLWAAQAAKGVVLAIHTFAWNSACFAELAKTLKPRHFSVIAYDLQGHGCSGSNEMTRGDLRRFEHFLADAEKLIHFTKQTYPELPLFVLGDGFGATLALHVALRSDRQIQGLVLCGPYVLPDLDQHPPSHITPVLFALQKLLPDLRIATVEMGKNPIHRETDPPLQSPTLRFFVTAHRSLKHLRKRVRQLKCPFITLHAAFDPRASSQHSRELFSRAKSQEKTLMIYDNKHSCLFGEHEEDRSHVMTDILAWLDARTHVGERSPRVEQRPQREAIPSTSECSIAKRQQRLLDLMSRNGF